MKNAKVMRFRVVGLFFVPFISEENQKEIKW